MDVNNKEFEKVLDVFLKQRTKAQENLPTTPHFDEDMINALFESQLSEREKTFFATHLIDCNSCRRIVAQFAQTVFEGEMMTVDMPRTSTEGTENGILSRLAERFFNVSDNAVLAHQSEDAVKDEVKREKESV